MALHTIRRGAIAAEIAAVAGKIQDDVTLLGVAGTLAAADITLEHVGKLAGANTVLSGCNIGTVTLTDCYSDPTDAGAYASTLNLSNNRMDADALADLVTALHTEIVTGASSAVLTLDISGNAVPNAATMVKIYALCTAMVTGSVMIEEPGAVAGTAAAVGGVAAQGYDYDPATSVWVGDVDGALLYRGGGWRLYFDGHTWSGADGESMAGEYTLADHTTITISIV